MSRAFTFKLSHQPSDDGASWTTGNDPDDQSDRADIDQFTTNEQGQLVGPDGTVYRPVKGGDEVVLTPADVTGTDLFSSVPGGIYKQGIGTVLAARWGDPDQAHLAKVIKTALRRRRLPLTSFQFNEVSNDAATRITALLTSTTPQPGPARTWRESIQACLIDALDAEGIRTENEGGVPYMVDLDEAADLVALIDQALTSDPVGLLRPINDDEAAALVTTSDNGGDQLDRPINVVDHWWRRWGRRMLGKTLLVSGAITVMASVMPRRHVALDFDEVVALLVLAAIGVALAVAAPVVAMAQDRWVFSAPSWDVRRWRIRRRWYGSGHLVDVDGETATVLDWVSDRFYGGGVCVLVAWLDGSGPADWLPLSELRPTATQPPPGSGS
jgi:hypothetical protein